MHRPDIAPRAGAYHLSLITQQMFAEPFRDGTSLPAETCSAFLHACCADAVLCLRDAHRIFSVEQLTPCHTSSLVVTNPGTISTCHVHG